MIPIKITAHFLYLHRWRILKTGIRVHGRELYGKVDNIWLTCCALHNWLLEVDGLSDKWEQGTQGDWEGSWGLHDASDAARFGVGRDADLSGLGGDVEGMGNEDEEEDEDQEEEEGENGPARLVRRMDQEDFRCKLISHFSYKWRRREIEWPSRDGKKTWEPPPSFFSHLPVQLRVPTPAN